jgi:hypothetical protein
VLVAVTHEVVRTRALFAAYVALVFAGVGVRPIRVLVQDGSCFELLLTFIAVHPVRIDIKHIYKNGWRG